MLFFLFAVSIYAKPNSLKLLPEKPKAGEKINVTYNPSGTVLVNADNIEMYVYLYSKKSAGEYGIENCRSVNMRKNSGNNWAAEINTTSITEIAAVKFVAGNITDNNDGSGYFVKLYDDTGNETNSSILGYAAAFYSWGNRTGLVAENKKKTYEIMKKYLDADAELKARYCSDYLSVIYSVWGPKESRPILLKELAELENRNDIVENDYLAMMSLYRVMNEQAKSEAIQKTVMAKYPNGRLAAAEKISFKVDNDANNVIAKVKIIESSFKGTEYAGKASLCAFLQLLEQGKYDLLKELWEYIVDSGNIQLEYSKVITPFIKNNELSLGLEIAKKEVELWHNEAAGHATLKPSYKTEKEYSNYAKSKYARVLCDYGQILNKLDRNEEALKQYEEALSLKALNEYEPEIVEGYLTCLKDNKKYEAVQPLLEDAIKTGKFTNGMKALLKEVYTLKNGNDNGYDSYSAKIEGTSKENMFETVKQKMFKKSANQFTLKDLKGKTVNMADLKGKIIILDFWATWCGSCIASFPEMKTIVEKYANDKDVVFIFIDTFENSDKQEEKAKKIITDNNYPFNVLFDTDHSVVKSFGINVIPTKIFIDKEGNWRFTTVGHDKDLTPDEIDLVIQMLK